MVEHSLLAWFGSLDAMPDSRSVAAVRKPKRPVRKEFPETWLWTEEAVK